MYPLDPAESSSCTADATCGAGAVRPVTGHSHAVIQRNGDLIRLAPDGPDKIGEERVGRLVLDGDVILPSDGPTINERRKIASDCGRRAGGRRGRLAGKIVVRPSACRSNRTARFHRRRCRCGDTRLSTGAGHRKAARAVPAVPLRHPWTGKKPVVE
jgi:ribonuclease J